MKQAISTFIVVILATLNFVFAQNDPTLGINMVPMLTVTGNPGERFEIQYSSDLGATDPWKVLDVVSTYDRPVIYCDTSSVGQPKRFYRLFKLPPADSLIWEERDDGINNPSVIEVDDSSDTDNVGVYSINLKAVGADVTIQRISVTFENGETTTSNLGDMISSVYLVVDGEQVGSEAFSVSTVNFDEPLELLQGDSKEMIINVDLDSQSGNYENGSSFLVSNVTINYIDHYGNPGILSATPQGGLKVLRTFGSSFEFISSSVQFGGNQSTGLYTINFKLTAFNSDTYIPADGSSVSYEVLDEASEILSLPNSKSLSSISGITIDRGYFRISDGNTGTLRLNVYVDNGSQSSPQNIRVRLKNVGCRFDSIVAPLEPAPLLVPNTAQTQLFLLQN